MCDILIKYKFLLYRTLGTWNNKPVYIEIQLDAKPYHAKPYPVPRSKKSAFKKSVKIILQVRVIYKSNYIRVGIPQLYPKKYGMLIYLCPILEN